MIVTYTISYMQKFLRFWVPVLLCMIVIFTLSMKQKIAVTDSYLVSFIFFKTIHLIEYASLFTLLYRALRNTVFDGKNSVAKKKSFFYAFIITAFYGLSDEIHQRFVPTREGKPRDAIIDMFGAGIAWIFIQHILPTQKKIRKWLEKNWQIS